MFNSILKGIFRGQKHPGRCPFSEPELLSTESLNMKLENRHKDPNSNNLHNAEIKLLYRISKGNSKLNSTLEQRTPKSQSYRL